MKVISQLARHFWDQGALSVEQADFMVSQGFVREQDLEGYKPVQFEADSHTVFAVKDAFDAVADELARRTSRARRRGPRPDRAAPSFEGLCDRLGDEFDRRAGALPALTDLAGSFGPCSAWGPGAVVLRHVPDDRFRRALGDRLRARSSSLGDLWRAVDPEPFHALVAGPSLRDPTVRAFRALLLVGEPRRLGKYAWVLKADEVAAVGNLLAVYRRLLSALHHLYRDRDRDLAAVLHEGVPPVLHWAFVLLYNADRRAATDRRFGPTRECDPAECGDGVDWRKLTTCALLMAPEVRPRLRELEGRRAPLARPWAWRTAAEG